MDKKELQMLGFEIVAYSGDARSTLLQLLKEVRSGNFDNVDKAIKDADGIANYVLDKGNFELKHKLGELCKEVIQEDKYEPNSITMDQLEESLKIKNIPCDIYNSHEYGFQ